MQHCQFGVYLQPAISQTPSPSTCRAHSVSLAVAKFGPFLILLYQAHSKKAGSWYGPTPADAGIVILHYKDFYNRTDCTDASPKVYREVSSECTQA